VSEGAIYAVILDLDAGDRRTWRNSGRLCDLSDRTAARRGTTLVSPIRFSIWHNHILLATSARDG